jgi:hypothetical protein
MGKSKELAELGSTITQDNGTTTFSDDTLAIVTASSGGTTLSNFAYATGFTYDLSNASVVHTIGTSSAARTVFKTDNIERMTIDASGRVTMPYQASFNAYAPAASTPAGSDIVYGSTYHNIGNHYNTSTGVFTAPIAGRYLFTASCLFNYSSGGYHRLNFKLNGSVYNTYGETLENQAGPAYSAATISNIFALNANDTVQMQNGSSVTTYGSTSYGHFSGIMLA